MSRTLVIVESPAKAKKIGSFLGPQFTVKASVGHIRDLPRKALGVDLETFAPTYEINEDKKTTVSDLRKLSKTHDKIVIATDLDREGEAIGWHIKAALNLSDAQYERVAYGEITESAIRKAMAAPRKLDMDQVAAQEARRVLDRLIGYLVSPALSDQAGKTLSAGRVQSVAVRLVVDREREIQNFQPQTFYGVGLQLNAYPEVKAGLVLKPWAKDGEHLWDRRDAEQFCGDQTVTLIKKDTKTVKVKPRPPFTTVTMQGVAGKRFGLTAAEVMQAAQKLFDNGHITYHRTDNPNLSDEGYELLRSHLEYNGHDTNPSRPTYPAKADAQEAHEAIRPTDPARTQAGDSQTERDVYSLIRERALCVALPFGEDAKTQFVFQSQGHYADLAGTARPAHYVAQGKVIQVSGWRRHAVIESVTEKDKPLPDLQKGHNYEGVVKAEEKQTKPPGRYTEHTLVKTLEAAGIGRPATYAAILENIKGRFYIVPEKKGGKKAETYFVPGDDGYYIVDALKNMTFLGYKYTQSVEKTLDEVAKGNKGYINIVRPMYQQLRQDIDERLDAYSLVETEDCPKCGEAVIQKQKRRKGGKLNVFWVHKNPDHATPCGITFLNDLDGVPAIPEPTKTRDCPVCSEPLIRRKNDRGYYWTHEDRKQGDACGTKFFPDEDGTPIVPEKPKTAPCAKCGDTLTRRYSKKTEKYLWVHAKKKPECGSFFVDDEDGVPAIALEGD